MSVLICVLAGAAGCKLLHQGKDQAPEPAKVPLMVVHLETFVVNLADEDQHAFLRIGVDLGIVEPEKKKTKENESAQPISPVRDVILGVLMASSSTDLATAEGKQKLKREILKALNDRLPALQTREVYFTEFLLQR